MRKYEIGGWTVVELEDGIFRLDGGAMFGVVPKTLWSRKVEADEANRIRLSLCGLLLDDGKSRILIDTGIGDKFGGKELSMYSIERRRGQLFEELREAGYSPGDVTDVVLTHLHFDHAGNATIRRGERPEEYVPAFPGARYHVQREHWEWALSPSERDRASFRPADFEPLAALEPEGRLVLHGDGDSIADGVTVHASSSHTPGHQHVIVRTAGECIVHCGDLVPTRAHVRLPYIMGYDLFPLGTLEEKKKLFAEAAQGRWLLFAEHDPANRWFTVEADGKGGWKPAAVPSDSMRPLG